MNIPKPYCIHTRIPHYFAALKFARVSPEPLNIALEDTDNFIETLNNLSTINTSVRSILPLIYGNAVKSELFEQLNQDAQKYLKQNTMILIAGEMQNKKWLKNSFELFGNQNLPIILLKGAAFADDLYPQNTPRIGVDLDFLVRKSDFKKACELLEETMQAVVQADDRLATHNKLFERMFVPKERLSPTVEIHQGLTNPYIFSIDEDSLWSGSQIHPAYDNELVRVLSPEDTLLHLAIHAFRDLDFCTHNLLDTHEIIYQKIIDTDVLLKRASAWGAKKSLYYLLYNARTILNTPIRENLLSKLKPNSLSNNVNRKILQSSSLQDSTKSFSYRFIQLASQLTIPDKKANSLRFQAHYAAIRLKDIFTH